MQLRFDLRRSELGDAARAVAIENHHARARRRKRARRAWQRGDASAVETVRAQGYRGPWVLRSNPKLLRAYTAEQEAEVPEAAPRAMLMNRTRPARAGAKLGRVRLHLLKEGVARR